MKISEPTQADATLIDAQQGKFFQGCTVALTASAFLFNQPLISLFTAGTMGLNVLATKFSPYRLLYHKLIVPLGLLQPRMVEDDPAPHRFAQGIGGIFLLAASLVLSFTRAKKLGWTLNLIVFVLSSINLTTGFCAGCFMYHQLSRLGILPKKVVATSEER